MTFLDGISFLLSFLINYKDYHLLGGNKEKDKYNEYKRTQRNVRNMKEYRKEYKEI